MYADDPLFLAGFEDEIKPSVACDNEAKHLTYFNKNVLKRTFLSIFSFI